MVSALPCRPIQCISHLPNLYRRAPRKRIQKEDCHQRTAAWQHAQAESRTRGCDFHVFHDWSLVHLITRPTSGLSVHDLAARENGNWLRLMVSRCPGRITFGHPAMWAQCPVCPKADMVGRFMSTRLSLTLDCRQCCSSHEIAEFQVTCFAFGFDLLHQRVAQS